VRLQIAQIEEEVLRRPANQLSREDILSAKTRELIEHMRDTMRNASGVGLAAAQVGVPLQLAAIRTVRNITRSSVPRNYPRGKGNRFHFTSLLILGLFGRTTKVSNSLRAA
jgi:peptide deformylase